MANQIKLGLEEHVIYQLKQASNGIAALVKVAVNTGPDSMVGSNPTVAPSTGVPMPPASFPADPNAPATAKSLAGQLLNSVDVLTRAITNWGKLNAQRAEAQRLLGTTFTNLQRLVTQQESIKGPLSSILPNAYRILTQTINIKGVAPEKAVAALKDFAKTIQLSAVPGGQKQYTRAPGRQGLDTVGPEYAAPAAMPEDRHFKPSNTPAPAQPKKPGIWSRMGKGLKDFAREAYNPTDRFAPDNKLSSLTLTDNGYFKSASNKDVWGWKLV